MRKRKDKTEIILKNFPILDAGSEGVCVGKHEGKVVFVRNVVPQDVIDAVITKKKRAYYEAKPLRIVSPSADRVEPACEHFGICGGCKWQNMVYSKQLFYKQKQVEDNFRRIGKFDFPEPNPIIASEHIFGYRNKIEYTFSSKKWLTKEEFDRVEDPAGEGGGLGFHLSGIFDKALDIRYCHLHDQTGNRIRNQVREFALQHHISFADIRNHEGLLRNLILRTSVCGDRMVILVVRFFDDRARTVLEFIKDTFAELTSVLYVENAKLNDSIVDLPVHLFSGKEFMMERMGDLQFKVAPLAFYQTNALQAVRLYQAAADMAAIRSTETVYDLYTGTGTIALFVARQARRVIGIEQIASAVENARENAQLNRIDNVSFFDGDMIDVLTDDFVRNNGRPDVLITDPPRAGMHPKVVQELRKIAPSRIVYISCNPATQARDIALLCDAYRVEKVQPVDMFPHTHHVENITLLVRKENGAKNPAVFSPEENIL
jgi:23S rRNA (uracil1939-C5)-methyltransferase